jgi:hypothetical protein
MNDRRHLHLVDREPPAPRLAVRINAFAGRGAPHGRSRAFRLTEVDLDELIEHAACLENGGRR